MKNYELKNKLNDYDKLIDLYRNFILLSPDLLSLTPQVKVTKKDDTLKFQAFGKVAEVRFTMVIKDDISQGKITAFLLGTENCQPFERELFTNLFDTLGNFKGERPLISCGLDEDNSQLNLIHFILRSLIEKEMTVSG